MQRVSAAQMHHLNKIFGDSEETLIWSCLQNVMGEAWADDPQHPICAKITIADFCFFGGDASAAGAQDLITHIPQGYKKDFILMVPTDEHWKAPIETIYEGRQIAFERHAIKKEQDVFDLPRLQALAEALPAGFSLVPLDESICRLALQEEWSADFCSHFADIADYLQRGLGFAVMHGDELVCGASSYTIYNGGIEIEIDTKVPYRRMGLATACAARLMVECLQKGLYPSWDAANMESVALAEKLGYHYDKAYTTYYIKL